MKIIKQCKRIILISLVLIVLLACYRASYASVLSSIGDFGSAVGNKIGDIVHNFGTEITAGIVGLLALGIQQLAVLIFGALQLLTAFITGSAGDTVISIGDVVFNRSGLTSANFFPEIWIGPQNSASLDIFENISKYYYVIRSLSIALLLGILLYVGIRMAISTVASEEAKYKKMFKDWAVSLVIVFVLHYIIIITFFINNVLVNALSKLEPEITGFEMAGLALDAAIPGVGIPDLIVYGAFVTGTLAFVLMYIKRTIVLGFLIVISPLITVTYSLDKMGDGKSQALNNWLREFIFTVIIQPFHCIIYLVFYGSIMSTLSGSNNDIGKMIFAAASAFFMLKAEGIVKKIFGIQPSSIGDAIGTGAMALTMATSMFKGGKGKKLNESKGKMDKMKNNSSVDKKEEKKDRNRQAVNNNNNNNNNNNGTMESTETNSPGDAVQDDDNSNGTATPASQESADANSTNNNTAKKSSKIGKALKTAGGVATFVPRKIIHAQAKSFKRQGGLQGWAGRKISGAATFAGLIAGGSVGDIKTAMSVGTAAGGIAKNAYDEFLYNKAEDQLEKNQKVFAGAYEDFARAYREEHAGENISDQELRAIARQIYEGSGVDLDSQYQRDFRDKMEQLSDSAEIMGYGNGFDYVNESMRLAQEGVILPTSDYEPKHYDDLRRSQHNRYNSNESQEDFNRRQRQRNENARRRYNPNNSSTMDEI